MPLTDEQKAQRRLGIGSSEIAALAGLPAFMTPIEVYRAKVEENFDRDAGWFGVIGSLLEDDVLELLRRKDGYTYEYPGTLKHPLFPIVATPDAVARKDGTLYAVEAKTALPWRMDGFGAEGTDEVPPCYLVQCQWHMLVLRAHGYAVAECLVPVLVGTLELRIYRVPFDAALAENLVGVAMEFWNTHVLPRVPPPVDGTAAYADYLAQAYSAPEPQTLPANDDAEKWAKEYARTSAIYETIKKELELAKNNLKALAGNSEGLQGAGWRATWKEDSKGNRRFNFRNGRH
jgi:predicted phage-related endonuclease